MAIRAGFSALGSGLTADAFGAWASGLRPFFDQMLEIVYNPSPNFSFQTAMSVGRALRGTVQVTLRYAPCPSCLGRLS
jgi:hypothetical protein